MRVTIDTNSNGETIMIFPKSAPVGFVSQIRRVTKIQREYKGQLDHLVFVLAD